MMNAADVDLDDFTAFEGGANTAFSSPAVQSVFDFVGSGSASSSTSNLGTISPHDLLVNEPFMSAPNSSALTALTSPSVANESPDYDSFDVSPNFGSADFDGPPMEAWYPLFPTESGPESLVDNSPAQQSDDLETVERPSTGSRRKSGGSPTTSTRHSAVSGVGSRKRDKPLPPIIVDNPNDTVAMKRARNTLAARKSRERKAQRFDELEDRIAKLEAERDHWKNLALSRTGA
nr:putative transcription factor [Sesquicillium sp.]